MARSSEEPDQDVLDQPEDEPIVLVGAPDELRGELRLRNAGDRKMILRDARVRGGRREARKKGEKEGPTLPDVALRRIVLRGGEARSVPISIPMSPHTPPGEYRGRIEVGGRGRDVVMHVTDSVRLEASPRRVLVENWPGQTIGKRVVFTNAGNVPLTIGEIGPVVLQDPLLDCRTHRAAVAAVGDQVSKLDDYLAELARQTKAVLERTEPLRVHLTSGEMTLGPGEVGVAELEVRVPEKLDRRTRYMGVAALYDLNLEFVLAPAHAPARKPDTQSPA